MAASQTDSPRQTPVSAPAIRLRPYRRLLRRPRPIPPPIDCRAIAAKVSSGSESGRADIAYLHEQIFDGANSGELQTLEGLAMNLGARTDTLRSEKKSLGARIGLEGAGVVTVPGTPLSVFDWLTMLIYGIGALALLWASWNVLQSVLVNNGHAKSPAEARAFSLFALAAPVILEVLARLTENAAERRRFARRVASVCLVFFLGWVVLWVLTYCRAAPGANNSPDLLASILSSPVAIATSLGRALLIVQVLGETLLAALLWLGIDFILARHPRTDRERKELLARFKQVDRMLAAAEFVLDHLIGRRDGVRADRARFIQQAENEFDLALVNRANLISFQQPRKDRHSLDDRFRDAIDDHSSTTQSGFPLNHKEGTHQ